MKVKHALEMLNQLPLESEICIEWYEKEDMEYKGELLSDEVWSKALHLMDKWSELSDLHDSLRGAILEAQSNLKKGN
jgi:hypothetical protein